MDEGTPLPRWAPRLPQHLIRRLYDTDARGIYNEELLDEVGWALRERCQSFAVAVAAVRGRAACPVCETVIVHRGVPDEVLRCPSCGWQSTWAAYFGTIRHQQLSGADAVLQAFERFVERFPLADTPQQKMLLIDEVIHSFHMDLLGRPSRTAGINLIEGRYHDVIEFLGRLAYRDSSTPGTRETHLEWRRTIRDTGERYNSDWLRRVG